MSMKALLESLKGQASGAVATVREGADAAGETVDPGDNEGDGVALEPSEPNPQAEGTLFAGWDEGVPLVATGTAIGYTEDGDEVEVDQDTTAEVVGVALDQDPPGAVIMLDDGTQLAIEADGAAMWAIVQGDEDEGVASDAATDDAADADMPESVDPLMGSLRRIIDEARKAKKKAPKGKKGKGQGKACDGSGPGPQARQGMAEATDAPPSYAEEAAKAYVYAQLLADVLAGMPETDGAAEISKAGSNLAELADRFLTRAKPIMRKMGVSPAVLQRLAGKVVSRVDGMAATIVGTPAE